MVHPLADTISPGLWRRADMADALCRRDIGAVYRVLHTQGFTYRQLGIVAGHGEPEVHAIVHGREVRRYDVLLRIAVSFGIPLGLMGLAGDYLTEPEEVDEDVQRRQFLGLAAAAAVGAPLPDINFADTTALWEANRVAPSDVTMLDAMVGRLRVLDQEQGGQASHDATVALLQRALRLTGADMTDYTRTKLLSFIAHTHSFVGWSASDAGDATNARDHFRQSLTAGKEARDHAAVARTLHLAARNELLWGDPREALKLFQLAALPAEQSGSNLLPATITADSAIVLAQSGYPDMACTATEQARERLSTVNFDTDPAPWFQASDVTSALSAARFHIGHQDDAITEITDALHGTSENRTRSRAFRLANLAEFHLTAGDEAEGIEAGRAALQLAGAVTSARLPVRLAPAAAAADRYSSSDARDLAHAIRGLNA